ncbi:MAG: hypothetical protein OXH52_20890 [Gammaproteobacteria bacterium]|nr:hypothetical protein [Gammaproteobacteria bacterium]
MLVGLGSVTIAAPASASLRRRALGVLDHRLGESARRAGIIWAQFAVGIAVPVHRWASAVASGAYISGMSIPPSFPEEFTQAQRLLDFLDGDKGSWTTVYESLRPDQDFGIFSAFMPHSRRAELLARPEWEMCPYDGRPAFIEDERGRYRYARYGQTDNAKPVVILLSHDGAVPAMLPQVLEEFRHFHDLWEEAAGGIHKKLHADGSAEEVCRVTHQHAQIRTAYLRRFQAATQLYLVRFVDSIINTPNRQRLTAADVAPLEQTVRTESHVWRRDIRLEGRPGEVSSRILAKTIAAPPPRDQCGAWPWDRPTAAGAAHLHFVVDESATGAPIEHTCDPEALSSDFGVSPDLPLGQLTPVFFEKSVLQRYYSDPQKYRVDDNSVACGALWSMRIDNNQPEHVVVLLYELGVALPEREQHHWRAHNIAPPGSGLSRAAYGRWIQGEWTAPDYPEWQFKHWYGAFRGQCRKRLGWDLWRDAPHADGSPLLQRVRVPLTDTAEDLNEQARLLDLILVEALNTQRLREELGVDKSDDRKSISLLEAWLAQIHHPHAQRDIALLRRVHRLRNAASHRGDDDPAKKPAAPSNHQQAGAEILAGATDMLRDLTQTI